MDKEVAFNTTKRRRKFLEAVDAGHILAEDVTEKDKKDILATKTYRGSQR